MRKGLSILAVLAVAMSAQFAMATEAAVVGECIVKYKQCMNDNLAGTVQKLTDAAHDLKDDPENPSALHDLKHQLKGLPVHVTQAAATCENEFGSCIGD
jgi:hypothetical protein